MKCQNVVNYKRRLDDLFDKAKMFQSRPEMSAHWANYLCVLLSGFLEIALREIYGTYVKNRTDSHIANFVIKKLDGVNNPKMEKILEVTGWFNSEWEKQLRLSIDEAHKDAIDSIIANRHLIAHGRPTGITYVRLKEWYKRAVETVDLLESQCEL